MQTTGLDRMLRRHRVDRTPTTQRRILVDRVQMERLPGERAVERLMAGSQMALLTASTEM